jgi:tRNA threonylcarbamoyladenosine biosynthesis protein TsaE
MCKLSIVTHTSEQTRELGKQLGRLLQSGDVLLLNGELGAGKTTLIQGIALGMDIRIPVCSPTFTLVQEYRGRLPLYHFDPYRLENPEEIAGVGFFDYLDFGGVTVVEWAERLQELAPDENMEIYISLLNDQSRKITFTPHGERYNDLIATMGDTAC